MNNISAINSDTLVTSVVTIVLCVVLTLVVAVAAVFVIGKYNKTDNENSLFIGKLKTFYVLLIACFVGLVLRVALALSFNGYGLTYDTAYGIAYDVSKASGFGGYTSAYVGVAPLTGYIYTLFGGWAILAKAGIDDIGMQFLLKLPYIIADVATFFSIYYISNKYTNKYVSLALACLYFLSPVSFVMSSIWGSEYAFLTVAIVWVLYFVLIKNVFGMVISTVLACLVSVDAIYFAIIVALYLLYLFVKSIIKIVKTKPNFDMIFKDDALYNVVYVPLCVIFGVVLVYLLSLPAYFADGVVGLNAVFEQLFIKPLDTLNGDGALHYFTTNGLGLYAVILENYGTLGPNFPTVLFAMLFLVLVGGIVTAIFLIKRNRANVLILSAYTFFTVGVYMIGSFEWSLVPALVLLVSTYAVIKDKRVFKVFVLTSMFVVLNALLVLLGGNMMSGVYQAGYFNLAEDGALNVLSIILSVCTMLTHIYFTIITLDVTLTNNRKTFKTDASSDFGDVIGEWIRG